MPGSQGLQPATSASGARVRTLSSAAVVDVNEEESVFAEPLDAGEAYSAAGARDDSDAHGSFSTSVVTSPVLSAVLDLLSEASAL